MTMCTGHIRREEQTLDLDHWTKITFLDSILWITVLSNNFKKIRSEVLLRLRSFRTKPIVSIRFGVLSQTVYYLRVSRKQVILYRVFP